MSTINVGDFLLAEMWRICDNGIMNKESFALILKKIRNERNLTQQELAEFVGLSRYTIQDWEAAKRTPNLDMLPKIALALDTSVAYLMGETEIKAPIKEPSLKVMNIRHNDWIEVPVLSKENAVCAGEGWDHDSIYPEVERYELLPRYMLGEISQYEHKRPYIVPVDGDSMEEADIPATFRGLPINLLYIGILALAIYGLTGHRLAI